MLQKIIQFVKYNNAFSIGFALVFLSFGTALAASPEIRQEVVNAVVSKQETVKSVDNTYIANIDLDFFTPKVQITDVTEDEDFYYVGYTLHTIDIADYVWQPKEKTEVMKVAKNDLGKNDLGLYVTQQLKDVVDRQLSYLKEVQIIEKNNGVTGKVVATVYSGLVGKFLNSKEEKIPGYVPVIVPEPEVFATTPTPTESVVQQTSITTDTSSSSAQTPSATSTESTTDTSTSTTATSTESTTDTSTSTTATSTESTTDTSTSTTTVIQTP